MVFFSFRSAKKFDLGDWTISIAIAHILGKKKLMLSDYPSKEKGVSSLKIRLILRFLFYSKGFFAYLKQLEYIIFFGGMKGFFEKIIKKSTRVWIKWRKKITRQILKQRK